MLRFIQEQKTTVFYKAVSLIVATAFSLSLVMPPQTAYAQAMVSLPLPGAMIPLSPAFSPVLIKGLKVHPENPFQFDFIIDKGETGMDGASLKEESNKLIKYFLASLTVPEEDLWVNLSPYEKDRIITEEFGLTEMGRDLLAQDYILKQLTASLIYPENDLGKKFWERVYKKAYEIFGTTEIPVNTFNKIWIMPDEAEINEINDMAFVVKSRLKVMLEEDYLASRETKDQRPKTKDVAEVSSLSSAVLKQIIIPEIEKEVNEGKNFAQLRQIYNSLILAAWYKRSLKESVLGQIYVDQKKVSGIDVDDKEVKQKIYEKYLEAYKKGIYNYNKEDYDKYSQQMIPRKYFSGGVEWRVDKAMIVDKVPQRSWGRKLTGILGGLTIVLASTVLVQPDRAQDTPVPIVSQAEGVSDQAMLTDEIFRARISRRAEELGNQGNTERKARLMRLTAALAVYDPDDPQKAIGILKGEGFLTPEEANLTVDRFREVGREALAHAPALLWAAFPRSIGEDVQRQSLYRQVFHELERLRDKPVHIEKQSYSKADLGQFKEGLQINIGSGAMELTIAESSQQPGALEVRQMIFGKKPVAIIAKVQEEGKEIPVLQTGLFLNQGDSLLLMGRKEEQSVTALQIGNKFYSLKFIPGDKIPILAETEIPSDVEAQWTLRHVIRHTDEGIELEQREEAFESMVAQRVTLPVEMRDGDEVYIRYRQPFKIILGGRLGYLEGKVLTVRRNTTTRSGFLIEDDEGNSLPLDDEIVTLGRTRDSPFDLTRRGQTIISRQHLTVQMLPDPEQAGEDFIIISDTSRNGTVLEMTFETDPERVVSDNIDVLTYALPRDRTISGLIPIRLISMPRHGNLLNVYDARSDGEAEKEGIVLSIDKDRRIIIPEGFDETALHPNIKKAIDRYNDALERSLRWRDQARKIADEEKAKQEGMDKASEDSGDQAMLTHEVYPKIKKMIDTLRAGESPVVFNEDQFAQAVQDLFDWRKTVPQEREVKIRFETQDGRGQEWPLLNMNFPQLQTMGITFPQEVRLKDVEAFNAEEEAAMARSSLEEIGERSEQFISEDLDRMFSLTLKHLDLDDDVKRRLASLRELMKEQGYILTFGEGGSLERDKRVLYFDFGVQGAPSYDLGSKITAVFISVDGRPVADYAMLTEEKPVGGIDFNPQGLNLKINHDASGRPLPLTPQQIENIHLDGLTPVIINIVPITDIPMLLGEAAEGENLELSKL